MNPFDGDYYDGNFSDECRNFLNSLDMLESRRFKHEKSNDLIRMTLFYVAKESGAVIKTKQDKDGYLWIKRIG